MTSGNIENKVTEPPYAQMPSILKKVSRIIPRARSNPVSDSLNVFVFCILKPLFK